MKNIATLFSCCLLMAACGGEKSEHEKYYEDDYVADTTQTAAPVEQTKIGADAGVTEMKEGEAAAQAGEYAQGEKLIAMSDCLSCHRVEEKLVGPSYVEVAQKYEFNDKNVDYLAGKIIEGGSGVWGQVPMTPHPNISREDAREMAEYVLSLNKK